MDAMISNQNNLVSVNLTYVCEDLSIYQLKIQLIALVAAEIFGLAQQGFCWL